MAADLLPGQLLRDDELQAALEGSDSPGGNDGSATPTSFRTAGLAAVAVSSPSTTARKRRGFEAVHRGRYLASEQRLEWSLHRADALSGDRFKKLIFVKSALYEWFPAWVSVWLILALEGGNHRLATNRDLSPFCLQYWARGAFFFDALFATSTVSFVLWLHYQPPSISVWEISFTFGCFLMRGFVIASKYAFYTDMELQKDVGMRSRNYEVEWRGEKKQAANWVCNFTGTLMVKILAMLSRFVALPSRRS